MKIDVNGNRIEDDDNLEVSVTEGITIFSYDADPEEIELCIEGESFPLEEHEVDSLIKGLQLARERHFKVGDLI